MFKKTIVAAAAAVMLGAFGTSMAETKAEVKVESAAHKTAQATRNAAHKTASATRHAAHRTAHATRHVAHKTANATRHAAHRTAVATRHVAHRVIPTVKEAPGYRAATTREQRMTDARANWERTRKL